MINSPEPNEALLSLKELARFEKDSEFKVPLTCAGIDHPMTFPVFGKYCKHIEVCHLKVKKANSSVLTCRATYNKSQWDQTLYILVLCVERDVRTISLWLLINWCWEFYHRIRQISRDISKLHLTDKFVVIRWTKRIRKKAVRKTKMMIAK